MESEPDEAYGSDSSGTGEEEPSNKKSKKVCIKSLFVKQHR